MKFVLAIVAVVFSWQLSAQFNLSGELTDSETGEVLIGATIYVEELKAGTSANGDGRYSISMQSGVYHVVYSFIGYQSERVEINLNKDIKKNIQLAPNSQELETVEVNAQRKDANVKEVQMSSVNLDIERIKSIPAIFGEVDIIKAIQLLPGVSSAGEGFSGFFVRGGGSDQNLVLIDDAQVYNASHLFGFFSVFNPDAVSDVQLYKGGIPARFGGRLASVLDVRLRNGNPDKLEGSGGIGLIASRFSLNGPIVKNKGSFFISGRRTYADAFLALSNNPSLRNNRLYFYDFNAKADYKINEKNHIYASAYLGRDVFTADANRANLNWGNFAASLHWKSIISESLVSDFKLIKTDYDYALIGREDNDVFEWRSFIRDASAKWDFTYFQNKNSRFKFGAQAIHHTFRPAEINIKNDDQFFDFLIEKDRALEYGIYVERTQDFTPRFSATYGLRYSLFQNLGGRDIFNYDDDFNVSDTIRVNKGVYNSQGGLEPRVGMRYVISDEASIKASYNRTFQYVQVASNSTGSSPLDVWFPASSNVAPQRADQVAAGYFKNFRNNTYETSIELYYKWQDNTIDFKNQAELLLNDALEGELRVGTSTAYGAEFLLRKNEGRFNGFIAYTLSKVTRTVDVDALSPGPETYAAPYDKRHDLAVVGTYQLNKRVSFGANFVYATGAAVTLPNGKYIFKGSQVPTYTARNAGRQESYHRFDLSCTLKNKNNDKRRVKSEWVFSVYNVYSRKNPFSYVFDTNESTGDPEVKKLYLFPVLPSVTYNFNF